MRNYNERIFNVIKEIKELSYNDYLNLDLSVVNTIIRKSINKIHVFDIFSGRIGELVFNIEDIIPRFSNLNDDSEIFILVSRFPLEKVCNLQLYKMIKREYIVIDSILLIKIIELLADNDRDLWCYHKQNYSYDFNFDLFNRTNTGLKFTEEEMIQGNVLLNSMSIGNNEPFVCIHVRDSGYLASINKDVDWSYHDYRDSDINTYIKALEHLAGKGYSCIRMGYNSKQSLEIENKRIIDYATNYRTDFGDIFLCAKCKFMIGTNSGLSQVPSLFNVPVIWVNMIPFGAAPYLKDDLYIPKKLWYIEEKRFLTFREMLDSRIQEWGQFSQNYKKMGVEIIDNTPDEILDVTVEMNERLNSTWIETDEDKYYQNILKSMYKPGDWAYGSSAKMGAKFLRENINLLDLS
ncbi:MAG: TIGR04372 family glycosyltransferase [Bacillota bacterium]